jgi:hypothetical protein
VKQSQNVLSINYFHQLEQPEPRGRRYKRRKYGGWVEGGRDSYGSRFIKSLVERYHCSWRTKINYTTSPTDTFDAVYPGAVAQSEMAFAPERGHFEAYETYRRERPKSATTSSDVYGTKSIANTPSAAESAFLIMKQIHNTTGEVSPDRGRSLFENLQYIKTEPSVKVLQKTPWRQYFQDVGAGVADQMVHGKGKEINRSSISISKNEINYPQLFDQLVKRVQGLWKELHLPDSDRDFYSYALLQGPYQKSTQIDELTRYIKVLHQHRRATIHVLQAISQREAAIVQCIELIASVRRMSSLKFLSVQEGTRKTSNSSDQNQELARGILESLQRVQRTSLLVAEKVKLWRQDLWRPQAFM